MLLTAAPVDTFEQARILLSRVLPWSPLGDPSAVMNIHWKFEPKDEFRGQPWTGRACFTIEECIKAIQFAQKKQDTRDIYFATASMRSYEEKQYANGGGSWRKAIRNIENVRQIRSLWVDVDVELGNKSGKAYPTTEEAIKAFAAFVKDAGLPRPTIVVASGSGGFHAYWTMNEALEIDVWKPMAFAMAEATRRFGLNCDTGCTVDPARILRVPNTMNFKHEPPKPVTFLGKVQEHDYTREQMQSALAPYMGAQVITLTPRGNNAPSQNSELSGGIPQRKAAPVDLDSIADAGCGFVAGAIALGGANYANPLWNITTLLATFTGGGRADAHRMASGHPAYSAADTDALYDRKEQERAVRDLGWPSCDAVENAGCKSCAGCPIRKPGSKPLQFGKNVNQVAAAAAVGQSAPPQGALAPVTADLPHGYMRDTEGMIKKVVVTADGTSALILIAPYPMHDPWVQSDPEWKLHFKTRTGSTARETQIGIAYVDINSTDTFAKRLGAQGITLSKDQSALMREFIVSWSQKLKTLKDSVVSAAPFGWVEEHGGKVSGFAYGGRVWMPNEDKPASTPDHVINSQYTPRGNLTAWTIAAAMVTGNKSPARDAYLAAAFAGPLVRFTGQSGILVSTYSAESGIGKSTALKVAQAVWGSPVKAVQSLSDTQNSVLNKMGILQALPLFWDELKTDTDTNRFVNITFQLSGGKEKSRMGADAQLRDVGIWKTLLMSASNDSILDSVQRHTKTSAAGIYRVFEYQVPPVAQTMTTAAADQIMLKLDNNFGMAGLEYAKFLGQNHEAIHKEVADMKEALENALMSKPDERYWIAAIAVLLLGAKYANHLGLTMIDEEALYHFLVTCLGNMRLELRDSPVDMRDKRSVSNVLAQYINHRKSRGLLVTDHVYRGIGRAPRNSIKVLNDQTKLDHVVAQFGTEDKVLRVSSTNFRLWLEEMGYSPHNIMNAMKNEFGVGQAHGTIGAGTTIATFREYVIDFDMNHPELQNFAEFQ